jgi:hypothetical protein
MSWTNDDETTSFLPFLDILVAAIGIFLLIIALQKITEPVESTPPQADAVAIIRADKKLTWFELQEGKQIDIARYKISDKLKELAKRLKKPINIIVAFNAKQIEDMYYISDEIDYLATESAKNMNFRVVWWPLSSQPNADEEFLSTWKQ